jgi:hypothetical protein
MGQWLHFVRDNHVEEGDICLIEPVYLQNVNPL